MLALDSLVPSTCRRFVASLVLSAVVAPSQTVTVTPITDYTVTASVPGTVNTATIPAGVPTTSAMRVVGDHSTAVVGAAWSAFASLDRCAVQGSLQAVVATAGGVATKPVSDLRFTVQGLGARAVTIVISHTLTLVGTNQNPVLEVDVGDDGSVDATITSPTLTLARTLGPQPLHVRIRTASHVAQVASSLLGYRVEVFPDNNLSITYIGGGCSGTAIFAMPTFDTAGCLVFGGVDQPELGVFGLAATPQALPTAALPQCLLVPRPDLLTVLVPYQPLTLDPPFALRPLFVWAQGISLLANGIASGDALAIALH